MLNSVCIMPVSLNHVNVSCSFSREDWKPVLTINSIVYGLQYLFLVSNFGMFSQLNHVNQRKMPTLRTVISKRVCIVFVLKKK